MKSRIWIIALVAALLLPALACTNMNRAQQGALSGGVVGAGAGLGFSALTGGDLAWGTAIGGGIGGVLGGIYGQQQGRHHRHYHGK